MGKMTGVSDVSNKNSFKIACLIRHTAHVPVTNLTIFINHCLPGGWVAPHPHCITNSLVCQPPGHSLHNRNTVRAHIKLLHNTV